MRFDSVATVVAAAVAVLLQIILAPNIAIAAAMPNFILAYILVLSLVRPNNNSTLTCAFILGLSYDLLGHGPVGLMALLLVLGSFAVSRLYLIINNDTLFIPVIVLVLSSLLLEVVYASFLLGFGISANFVDTLVYPALPCVLYDCLFALGFYFAALRFLSTMPIQKSSGQVKKARSGPTAGQVQLHSPKVKKRRR